MFNAGLQRGEGVRAGEERGQAIGGSGVPWEISLHLSVSKTDVGEYRPLKGPQMLMGATYRPDTAQYTCQIIDGN